MPSSLAFQVDQYDQENWDQHTRFVEKEIPEPGQGEVLVQVYLRPVNPTDVILITTGWGHIPTPAVPGSEGVAKVVKNGSGSSKFSEGQRVVAVQWPQFQSQGSWQQYVVVKEETLVAVHESLSDETAAQFFINPVTVVGMVIALCKHKGIKTINVVRRDSAKQEILDAGGDVAISTESEDLVKCVKEVTGGKGAGAAIDPIGGKMTGKLVAALADGGKYMLYGALAAGEPCEVDHMDILTKSPIITNFLIYAWVEQPHKQEVLQETMDLLVKKVLDPYTGKKYPLREAKAAVKASLDTARGGKILLEG
ncbi:hypothetical protein WJX84_007390 [Apatococcus fuscideae]|uniref:Enoyl reductase (ER) domain-containing protein n=1 Tax=Apatococcus fuscideae TaxID=2026836 RepID=A0AAW1T783_9CHLO